MFLKFSEKKIEEKKPHKNNDNEVEIFNKFFYTIKTITHFRVRVDVTL